MSDEKPHPGKTAYSIEAAIRALSEASTHTHTLDGEHPDVSVMTIEDKLDRAESMIESAREQLDSGDSNG